MPRLSLYRSEKTSDYKFVDRTVYEMFQVGGVDVYVHKYIGPTDPSDPSKALGETTIQDVIFLENRDRKYDPDVYVLRGVYNVQDIDFNLSQFGLFLQNDTVFMTVHINNSVDILGRKVMPGDVVEFPNLRDDFALNDFSAGLKRFYVVEDVNRAAEGFSNLWYPHLYRLKLKPIMDSQEYRDILEKPAGENEDRFAGDWNETTTYYPGQIVRYAGILYEVTQESTGHQPPNGDYYTVSTVETLRDLQSTFNIETQINEAIIAEAESDAALSGYETRQFYTLQRDDEGNPTVITVDNEAVDASSGLNASRVSVPPVAEGYQGYLTGDGVPPNGEQFGFGIQFPKTATEGDYFLRTDYLPNRLFRYNGSRWVKFEDKVRMTLSNTDDRQTKRMGFVNNTEETMLQTLGSDAIKVSDPYVPPSGTITEMFDLMTQKVVTNIAFDEKYGVKAWVNNDIAKVSYYNEGGNIAITVDPNYLILQVGDQLRYEVFAKKIAQRQSLSKALRPEADF
jgi:hypothetical protein